MNRKANKGMLPLVILFIVLNAFFIAGRSMLESRGIDQEVLIIGNAVLMAITVISFLIAKSNLSNPNPNAFMRSVMGSIMAKMFLVIIAAFVYISIYQKGLNKPALFICMGLYLVYTFIEVSILMKLLKGKTNG
jgi:uncharacterized membrane protein